MASIERIFDNAMEGEHQRNWYPKRFERNDALFELYQGGDSETFDIEFSVQGDTFRAHKCIFLLKCKHEIPNERGNEEMPIDIDSVTSRSFKCLLEFIYTVKEPELDTGDMAAELLNAANFFGCVDLKLYVESVMVDKFLEVSNAANRLLFADAHSLALLKEAAINIVVTNLNSVRDTEGWSKVRESNRLLEELLDSYAPRSQGDDEIDRLDVAELRNRLQEAGLELDGSRESLVNRLKESAN